MSQGNPQQRLASEFIKLLEKEDQNSNREFIRNIVEEISEEKNRKVPEPVFREMFLPYFTGEVKMSSSEPAVAKWIGLVGSASLPTEVVNAKGETIFTVPPIYDTSRVNLTSHAKGGKSWSSILKEFTEDVAVAQIRARNNLAKDMAEKSSRSLQQGDGYSWKPVLDYYGISQKAADAVKKEGQKSSFDDDDLIYD